MPSSEAMRAIVHKQVRLWKTASHAEWRACFRPDYQIEDPVGTGFRPMGSYEAEWANMHAAALRLDMEIYRLTVGGNEIVADLRGVTHLGVPGLGPDQTDGARDTLSYTGIYTVDETGLLATNRTFADPISDALWRAFYPSLTPPSERPPLPRNERQLKQAVEDHLYFWNTGARDAWRRRFAEGAQIEDPVGSGLRDVDDDEGLWARAHARDRRVLLGCHRTIVCGMEVLAHSVQWVSEVGAPTTVACTEIFRFDGEGRIEGWRVFRDAR